MPNDLKRRNLSTVWSIFLLTSGWYGLYLITSISKSVLSQSSTFQRHATRVQYAISVVVLAMVAVFVVHIYRSTLSGNAGFGEAALGIYVKTIAGLMIFAGMSAYIVAGRLADVQISLGITPCSKFRSVYMTLLGFYSGVYLQQHINRVLDHRAEEGGASA